MRTLFLVALAIARGQHCVIQTRADLHLARRAHDGVDADTALRTHAHAHARLDDAQIADRMSGLFALDHRVHGGERARASQLARIDLYRETVCDVIEEG